MRKIASIILILLLSSCVTLRLERRMQPDVRNWYDLHQYIMLTNVPTEIDPNRPTEARYFLGLPDELQRRYIEVFWDLRSDSAKEEFQSILGTMEVVFRRKGRNPLQTDRGRLLLMCGRPDDVYQYKATGAGNEPDIEGDDPWDRLNKHYQVWIYRYGNGFFINQAQFVFECDSLGNWRLTGPWTTDHIQCRDFHQTQIGPFNWAVWESCCQ